MPTELFTNEALTTLSAAMTDTVGTTLTVASSAAFPAPSVGTSQFRIRIDNEYMIVTQVATLTWTVTRGADGSTAATHVINSQVRLVVTSGALNNFLQTTQGVDLTTAQTVGGVKTFSSNTLMSSYLVVQADVGIGASNVRSVLPYANLGVLATNTTVSTVLLRGMASQTGYILEIQNTTPTRVFSVLPSGDTYVAGSLTVASGFTLSAGSMTLPASSVAATAIAVGSLNAGLWRFTQPTYGATSSPAYSQAIQMYLDGVADTANGVRLAFHLGGVVASQIGMDRSGVIRTYDNPGTGYASFAAGNISSSGTVTAPAFTTSGAGAAVNVTSRDSTGDWVEYATASALRWYQGADRMSLSNVGLLSLFATGTSNALSVAYNGATADNNIYGVIGVTGPASVNTAYYSMTSAGNSVWGMGIGADNVMRVGSIASGKVMGGSVLRIDASANLTTPGSISIGAIPTGVGTERQNYGIRSNYAVTGGGNIIVDASYNFSWGNRFIVIGVGNGTSSATSGYFDINQPAAATALNVAGGAPARNWSASGVLLNGWEALWYVLPIGSANTSVASNFWVTLYTAGMTPPSSDWILLAIRNGDTNQVRVCTGLTLAAGSNVPAGRTTNTPVCVPYYLGGQTPVAISKPKFVATRVTVFTQARYYLEAGTMTPAIYVNGTNTVQGGSIGAGPVGGLWSFTAFTVQPGDRVQIGATAADATAAEFGVTLEGFAL